MYMYTFAAHRVCAGSAMGKGDGIGQRHASRTLEPLPVSPSLSPAGAAVSFADSRVNLGPGTSPSLVPLPDTRAPPQPGVARAKSGPPVVDVGGLWNRTVLSRAVGRRELLVDFHKRFSELGQGAAGVPPTVSGELRSGHSLAKNIQLRCMVARTMPSSLAGRGTRRCASGSGACL